MFIISHKNDGGNLGFWWEGNIPVFVEKTSGIFPSRGDCLHYLQKFMSKEKAIDAIVAIKNADGDCVSF